MVESLAKGYKPWLVASVAVLVASLMLLAAAVTAAFLYFGEQATPLWVVVTGGFAVFGILAGFGGFFLLMATAGWRSFREGRRVQVISPADHDPTKS